MIQILYLGETNNKIKVLHWIKQHEGKQMSLSPCVPLRLTVCPKTIPPPPTAFTQKAPGVGQMLLYDERMKAHHPVRRSEGHQRGPGEVSTVLVLGAHRQRSIVLESKSPDQYY